VDRSWLIERGADSRLAHSVGAVLAVVTFVAFAVAALAVVGWLIPDAWWTGLVFTGVVGSTLLLVLLFAPILVLGFVINADPGGPWRSRQPGRFRGDV
jgi:fatty acid desaturase